MSLSKMWCDWSRCVFVLVMVLNLGIIGRGVNGVSANISCSSVRTKYHGTELQDQIPPQPISGVSLSVCSSSSLTCCSTAVESALSVESRKQFDDALADRLEPLATLMGGRRKHFDDMFYSLLNLSKTSFDDMFRKTYGMIYLQNARVFDDLYNALERYYRTGQPDIGDQMDKFFRNFYQRMFVVYNSQYTFSEQYLSCVLTYMEKLQPFGDVPSKFSRSIKKSFVALRTFVKGLNTSASVVRNLLKVNPSVSCVRELMRVTHCSTCQGLPLVRPCLPYCLHVHTHCLHHLQQFSSDWKNFVDAMVTVGDRLLNPYNIENVVRPISLQISDAVMNFQIAGANISSMIFQGCGQPSLGPRTRRDTSDLAPADDPAINMIDGPAGESPNKRNAEYDPDSDQPIGRSGGRREGGGGRRRYRPQGVGDEELGSGGHNRSGGGRTGQRGRGRVAGRRKPVGSGGRRGGGGGMAGGGTSGRELSLERLDFSATSGVGEGDGSESSLNRVIREIKTKLENSRQFLEELAPQLCGKLASTQDSSCWTGTLLGRSADTPLPVLSPPPPHPGVHEQTYRLQTTTRLLQAAADGQDIAWLQEQRINDRAINDLDEAGSGSGDWTNDSEDEWGDAIPASTRSRTDPPSHQTRRPTSSPNFPPDDEDGYLGMGEGSGDTGGGRYRSPSSERGNDNVYYGGGGGGNTYPRYDDPAMEGSGDDYLYKKVNNNNNYNPPYQPNRPVYGDVPPNTHPPSGVAKDDMTLTKAITVYLIPAIIMYFGSIG